MFLRKLYALLACLIIGIGAFAQQQNDSTVVIPKSIYRSTFIGAAGGTNLLFGTESLTELKNFARFNATVDAYVGRWFSKSVGARLVYTGINAYAVDASDPDPDNRIRVNLNTINARADLMWNMNNSLGGFNPYRVWTLAPYIGVGYIGMSPEQKTTLYNSDINTIGMTAGLYNSFRISNVVSFTIDLRATTFDSKDFNANNTNKKSTYATLVSGSAGLAVKISRNWFVKKNNNRPAKVRKAKSYNVSDNSGQVYESDAALRAKIAQLEQKTQELEQQVALANQSAQKDTMLVKVVDSGNAFKASKVDNDTKKDKNNVDVSSLILYFEVGRPTIGLKELIKLEHYIDSVIKANPDKVFTIVGAVDKEQGNVDLAAKRSKYIYDLLKNRYGVKGTQLSNKGAHYSPEYNASNLNRVVIIK